MANDQFGLQDDLPPFRRSGALDPVNQQFYTDQSKVISGLGYGGQERQERAYVIE
nr:hypothetical protein [Paenactinomyces guangxiensis]